MVEVVCVEIAKQDWLDFTPWRSLNYDSFGYIRSALGVPDGAWEYIHRIDSLPPRDRERAKRVLESWVDDADNGRYNRITQFKAILDDLLGGLGGI